MTPQHVTSLELSQRLKELGVPQDSYFSWSIGVSGTRLVRTGLEENARCSAYLSSELGEMLPEWLELEEEFVDCDCGKSKIRNNFKTYLLDIRKSDSKKQWIVRYMRGEGVAFFEREKTEANARAKMLIHLLENNLIKVEDITI